jgi:hypothetical protein
VCRVDALRRGRDRHGEPRAEDVVRVERADLVTGGLDEQALALEAHHDDIVLGIVDLAGDDVGLDLRDRGDGLRHLHDVLARTVGPAGLVPAVVGHLPQLRARIVRPRGGRASGGGGEDDAVALGIDLEELVLEGCEFGLLDLGRVVGRA